MENMTAVKTDLSAARVAATEIFGSRATPAAAIDLFQRFENAKVAEVRAMTADIKRTWDTLVEEFGDKATPEDAISLFETLFCDE